TRNRSQGQSIPVVLVDIASPPSGTLSLFNLYAALSRKSGRETIRLEALDLQTQRWWETIQNHHSTEVAEAQDV
ncbi:hypothetical protein C8J57DRAFT_1097349, partial [Mycena rebaudengoi]